MRTNLHQIFIHRFFKDRCCGINTTRLQTHITLKRVFYSEMSRIFFNISDVKLEYKVLDNGYVKDISKDQCGVIKENYYIMFFHGNRWLHRTPFLLKTIEIIAPYVKG